MTLWICSEYERFELRSPDPCANPYVAYALIIYAGLDGITKNMELCPAIDINLFNADKTITDTLDKLPANLKEALSLARKSELINKYLPEILN